MFLQHLVEMGGFELNHHWYGIDVLIVFEAALLAMLGCAAATLFGQFRRSRKFRTLALALTMTFATAAYAANTALSALSASGALSGANLIYVVQTPGSGGVKATMTQVATYINSLFSGDATVASGGAVTFATVNSNVGSFGGATLCTTLTVNAKGLITAVSTATCTPAISSLTGAGTGILTALAVNVGTAGSPVINGGAGGTPSSITLTNGTALPIAGLTGLGTGVGTFLGTPSSASLLAALTTKTGTGLSVFGSAPTIDSLNATTAMTLAFLAGGGTQCVTVSNTGAMGAQACGSGGTPGGTSSQVQFNSSGSFGGFTVSGDATLNTATGALTFATVNSNVGSFGSATTCVAFTTNAKGLITAASAVTCTPGIANVTGLGTGVATLLGNASSGTGAPLGGTAPTISSPTINTAMTLGFLTGAGTECMQVSNTGVVSGTGSACGGSGSTGANPTATAGPTAVNGSASTFMRSDGAPAIQKASNSIFGIVEVDNTTITAASGVISTVNNGTVTSVGAGCGTSTGGSAITTTGNVIAALTRRLQSTTTDAIVAADCGNMVAESNASAIAISIAQAGTTGFAAGYYSQICNIGVGTATITPTTSTIGGASTYAIPGGTASAPVCVTVQSDGTNYNLVPDWMTNAGLLGNGTLLAARMPALTGDCTTSAGAVATTCTKTNGTAFGALATVTPGTSVATTLANNLNAAGGLISPTPTRAGDIVYWNGSSWTSLAGNNSGTQFLQETSSGVPSWAATSTSIVFPQTVSGTTNSGGIPYFSSTTVLTSSAALAANAIVIGGGAGAAPATTTTGSGVLTAIGNALSAAGGLTSTIASGTAAMGTSAIASGACATVVTVTATNVATTDTVSFGYNGDPTAVTGYGASATGAVLSIYPYPTSGNVNVKVCNSTASSITPSALTLNWRVTR